MGFALCGIILFLVFFFRPWRHQSTQFWKLYLPVAAVLILTVFFIIWRYKTHVDPSENAGIAFVGVIPLLSPVLILGKKRWKDIFDDEGKSGWKPE